MRCGRPGLAAVDDGRADAVPRLRQRRVRQPDEGEPGQPAGEVGLDLDDVADDADERHRVGARQRHASTPRTCSTWRRAAAAGEDADDVEPHLGGAPPVVGEPARREPSQPRGLGARDRLQRRAERRSRCGSSPRRPPGRRRRARRCRSRRARSASCARARRCPARPGAGPPRPRRTARARPWPACAPPPVRTLDPDGRRGTTRRHGALWTTRREASRTLWTPRRQSCGTCRSDCASSSTLTSLNVSTLTFLTNRAGRYMSHTHASLIVTSK